jgi:negative regulator of sigma-B (phosphoserine phosphatase)
MDSMSKVDIDYFIAERPLELVNGDIGFTCDDGNKMFVGLIDGAGHGPEANQIAKIFRDFLEKNKDKELPTLMQELHESVRGTRGGVAIIGFLDPGSLQFRYVAIGNITLRKLGNKSERAVAQDGVIGYSIRTPMEKTMQVSIGDILILHTDGISSYFDMTDYPEIINEDAKTIASNLISKFGKQDDDATCIVLRFKGVSNNLKC